MTESDRQQEFSYSTVCRIRVPVRIAEVRLSGQNCTSTLVKSQGADANVAIGGSITEYTYFCQHHMRRERHARLCRVINLGRHHQHDVLNRHIEISQIYGKLH